jgi:GNAT superfamily N-acetyltransferase
MIAAPHIEVLVAEINTEIIGFSDNARLEASKPYLNNETADILIYNTDPNYRGKGVNASIIKALKLWCNVHEVFELQTFIVTNDSAIKAYEKARDSKTPSNMSAGARKNAQRHRQLSVTG